MQPPVGSGRPQRESNPGPPHQESRALPTELPRPLIKAQRMIFTRKKKSKTYPLSSSSCHPVPSLLPFLFLFSIFLSLCNATAFRFLCLVALSSQSSLLRFFRPPYLSALPTPPVLSFIIPYCPCPISAPCLLHNLNPNLKGIYL